MGKLVIELLLITSTLVVFAHPGPTVIEADTPLLSEQNNELVQPLSPQQINRLKSWKMGDQNMWELSGQSEGDMVLFPGQISKSDPRSLSPQQIERLSSWKDGDQNMWELSGQTEGDMVLLPQQRNGLIHEMFRWPNKQIPYELSPVFSKDQADFIHEAVKAFAANSCVTVRPRTIADVDYVYVTGENTGCWSQVGRSGGAQQLNLQIVGCLWNQTVVHEFLHAAGFLHQQSATNRNSYVSIIWNNIEKGMEHNFDIYDKTFITDFGTKYDYGSVMHYSEKAFSTNGRETIVPLDKSWIGRLGIAQEMSDIDIKKLNKMYCNNADTFSGITRLGIVLTIFSVFSVL